MSNDLVKRLRTETNGDLGRLDAGSRWGMMIVEAANRIEELEALVENLLPPRRWELGDLVKKKSGAQWHGTVVGFYSTNLTPIGYCVASAFEENSVQIYPESALENWHV